MRKVLCLLLFLTGSFLQAQVATFRPNDLRDVPLPFDTANALAKRYHHITAYITVKPDNRVIEDKGLTEGYAFDTLGRMTEYFRTRVRGYETKEIKHPAVYRRGKRVRREWTEYKHTYSHDTVFVNFYYDSLNRIVVRRSRDGDIYNTWYYRYDSTSNQIRSQLQCRETNVGPSRKEFRLGMQTIISTEDFIYERLTPTQVKKKCLNDEGKVYKEIMLNYDANGNLIEEYHSYVVSFVKQTNLYAYDSLGRMKERTIRSYSGEELEEKMTLEYDSAGNISMQRFYRNGVLYFELSFLYNAELPGIYAMVNRRHKEALIDIVKYGYELYPVTKKP